MCFLFKMLMHFIPRYFLSPSLFFSFQPIAAEIYFPPKSGIVFFIASYYRQLSADIDIYVKLSVIRRDT